MCICIVFILQYQKVKNNYQIVLKRAETNVVPIIFNGVLFQSGYNVYLYGTKGLNGVQIPKFPIYGRYMQFIFLYVKQRTINNYVPLIIYNMHGHMTFWVQKWVWYTTDYDK
jgi:hypothetical protein